MVVLVVVLVVMDAIYHSVGGSDSRAFLGVFPPEFSKLCVYSAGT